MTKTQTAVADKLRSGSVIGELSDKVNGRYELFTLQPGAKKTNHPMDHNFKVERLNKNTFFALLAIGVIVQDDSVSASMSPFARDCWYRYNESFGQPIKEVKNAST